MAAMTATVTKFAQQGNSVTYTASGHTIAKPKLLLQKRKLPSGNANSVAELQTTVLFGTVDSVSSTAMAARIQLTAQCRRPVNATQADVDAAVALFRDFVASDAFTASINAQTFVS